MSVYNGKLDEYPLFMATFRFALNYFREQTVSLASVTRYSFAVECAAR